MQSCNRSLKDCLKDIISDSKDLVKPDVNIIDVVAFSKDSYPPAYQYYLSALHSGRRVNILRASDLSVHLLPYENEIRGIIAFTSGGKDVPIVNLAQTSYLLDVPLWIYGPPLHPAYEEKILDLNVKRVIVHSRHPIITMTISTLSWFLPSLPSARGDRLKEETDLLEESLDWLKERYNEEIALAKKEKIEYIITSSATSPGAYYLRSILKLKGVRPPVVLNVEELDYVPNESRVLIFSTTTEEHMLPKLKLETQLKNLKVVNIKFNTDPLTAGIYSMILSSIITESFI